MKSSQRLISNILNSMEGMNKKRKEFMRSIFILLMSIRGRHNFLNLSRYGDYCEKSYRLHYEKAFDFLRFNIMLCQEVLSDHKVLAFDPSFLSKSGKKTPHLDKFWSGCLGKAVRGLEIGGLAMVDLYNNTAFHLLSEQTPAQSVLDAKGWSRVDHYAAFIVKAYQELGQIADYLCVDGFFAKQKFIDPIMKHTRLHIICKLRKDADLRYLNKTPKVDDDGPGRPPIYSGKIDMKKIDKRKLRKAYQNDRVVIYQGVVNAKNLKRDIKLCYVELIKEGQPSGNYIVLFSTDLNLNGYTIFRYYKSRFQIEFLFRDAKQYTGLNHCEARSENKMHFHCNAALTAINIAKACHYLDQPTDEKKPFSMANVKSLYFNELMLDLILSNLEINPKSKKIRPLRKKIRNWGKIAA